MRRLFSALVLLVLVVPVAGATETEPLEPSVPEVVSEIAVDAPGEGDLQLEKVQVEERTAQADSDSERQLPPRGSFWWLVGVVVVAGVILAIVL